MRSWGMKIGEWIMMAGIVVALYVGGYIGTQHPASFYKCASTVRTIHVSSSVVRVYNEDGHGSGVVIRTVDGNDIVVLTAGHVAEHVVDGLLVQTQDGHTPRRVVKCVVDPNVDAALLFVDPNDPFDANEPPLSIGMEDCHVGYEVTLIGTPLDATLLNCVLLGHVVKVNVKILDYPWPNAFLIDAHGDSGCSGGPIFYNGKIVGICVGRVGSLVIALPVSEMPGLFGPCGGK